MGKVTGFLEFERLQEASEASNLRVRHFKEFVLHLTDDDAKVQGARCMDCGIPFCQNGCPVNNIIPDFNDLVYRQDWHAAIETLHSTNNFPEFTGRVCPAPCEAACTLNINNDAVGIKSIEHAIIDKAWASGWVVPQPAAQKTGKKVAVVGSGPAGMAAAQQLARVGHDVTLFEKNDRIGGLLRYGIPDFKMEKTHIDRRIEQMQAEGVVFRPGVLVGNELPGTITNHSTEIVAPAQLQQDFDAVLLTGGSEMPRDLPVPGRSLGGVHFAMEFLPLQNKVVAGDSVSGQIVAKDKHVVVIGGGDTGSDCVGTSNRQGARSITQFELLSQPPEHENKPMVWPYWPIKMRTSSSHEEGCDRDWSVTTKRFNDDGKGNVRSLTCSRVEWKKDEQSGQMKMVEIAGSEFDVPADLVLFAMGFVAPVASVLGAFGVDKDPRGNAAAATDGPLAYKTNIHKVFAAGDMRRGQSLVVWAIREGRQAARAVDDSDGIVGPADLVCMNNPALFDPLRLRGLTLPNRIVISPMCQYSAIDGHVTDWHLVHLGKLAQGGAGVVFVEATAVEPRGRITHGDTGLWDDSQVEGLARIAAFIRGQGAVPAIQLAHAGRKASMARPWFGNGPLAQADLDRGDHPWQPVAASAIPVDEGWLVPAEMTDADLRQLRQSFAAAAGRARAAGFDIVEIHGAHGYLLHSFLSPLSNQRTDQYGGDRAGRMRLALEIATEVRAAWPSDRPVFFRCSAIDDYEGGWQIEDSVEMARALAGIGIDVIDCSSGGIYDSATGAAKRMPRTARGPGFQLPYAARIRKDAGIATMAVGLILDAEQAEAALRGGQADLIAIGREALNDPNWPLHAARKLGSDPLFNRWPEQYGWWLTRRDAALKKLGIDTN